ncbi:hypothetical protein [Pengzhenrongella frigida]|uniref:Uncharacterized protein n=1 Tax=Pengzhenrongella frigida TaxID=1259133 RepID=A0A4Q5MV25_9MICO|nr:hypothetical protein [Cellulomonas sp. HLT2-17]RYV49335.1 hypothetical protein EUA98_19350 [Cellulomonas sp. HLT2-17]
MRTTTDDIVKRYLHRALPTVGVAVLLIAGAAPAVAVSAPPSSAAAAVFADSTTDPGDGHEAMPGMDMPAEDMPAGEETSHDDPAENMPGMDMPADEMTSDGDEHAGTVSRPRGAVLGTFAGLNAAVLISAAVLRRKTKNTHHPKRSTRVTTPATA